MSAVSDKYAAAGVSLDKSSKEYDKSIVEFLSALSNGDIVPVKSRLDGNISAKQLESMIAHNIIHKVRQSDGNSRFEFENVLAKRYFQQKCK